MADEITPDQIADAAAAPQSATNDGQQFTAHSLPHLIEADKHLTAKKAATKKRRGVGFLKLMSEPRE